MIVFKSIKPAKPFQSSIFRAELKTAAAQMENKILADFEKTTATWEHDVKFKASVAAGAAAGGIGVEVATKDKVYGYVDEGTKPHIIRPKKRNKRGLLSFQTGGHAKTRPKVIGSTAGRKGNKQVFAKEVHHPGTKARQFTKTISKKWQPEFRRQMDAAMRRAAKRSGHSTK